LPELPVVLEQLGGTSAADTSDELRAARVRSFKLSRYQQVYLKIPGLAEFEPRAATLDNEQIPIDLDAAGRVLATVLEHFRPERLMWGSDFPVVASREGYDNALNWCRKLMLDLAGSAGDAVFGATARAVFRTLHR